MDFIKIESALFYIALVLYLLSTVLYFLFMINKNEKAGKAGSIVVRIGFVLHTLALIFRTIGAKRLPLSNQYEFATSFAWAIALFFIIFEKRMKFRALGTFVVPIIFLIIGYAALQNKAVRPLMPALQSYWLVIHVVLAIFSYGSFAVAAGISIMYLLKDKFTDDAFMKKHIPSSEKLDIYSYRFVALGFLLLTLVIITGAIWAEVAWGRYWYWDPKETWALITWIIYAIYLHLRISRGWKDRRAAIFCIIGFACVLFTYIGVNTLLPSLHSYL